MPLDSLNDFEIKVDLDRVRRVQKIVGDDFALVFHFHEHVFDFANYSSNEVDGFIKVNNYVTYFFPDETTLDALLATIVSNMNCVVINDSYNVDVNVVNIEFVNKISKSLDVDDYMLRFHFGDNQYETRRDDFNSDGYIWEQNFIDYVFPDETSLDLVYNSIKKKIYKGYILPTTATTDVKITDAEITGVVEVVMWNGGLAIEGWTQTTGEIEFTDGTLLVPGQSVKLILR